MKRICKDCGTEFTITQGEIDFYNSKNFALPQRCKNCRQKRKGNDLDDQKPYIHHHVPQCKDDKTIYSKIAGFILIFLFLVFGIIPEITNLFHRNQSNVVNFPNTYSDDSTYSSSNRGLLQFRNDEYLSKHFSKHGGLLGHDSSESYLSGANNVIQSSSVLKRTQSDGDTAYYLESTNEFVVVSSDGYIRTYFKPTDGIDYFYRQ